MTTSTLCRSLFSVPALAPRMESNTPQTQDRPPAIQSQILMPSGSMPAVRSVAALEAGDDAGLWPLTQGRLGATATTSLAASGRGPFKGCFRFARVGLFDPLADGLPGRLT